MKMDGDLPNGEFAEPSPVDIGREFIRQYYTMLSEHPSDARRFYSHESTFIHNDVNVTGQQKIQKAIEEIGFNESKVRIFSIKGSGTISGGIVLQVAGEMTIRGSNTRRFIQTFVLGQQTAKKFYVHNDVFVFCDKVFMDSETSSPAPAVPVPIQKPILNGVQDSKTLLNGHPEQKPVTPIKEELKEPVKEPIITKKEVTPKKIEVENKPAEVIPEPVKPSPPVDNTPKTWARLVGGGSGNSTKVQEQKAAPVQQHAPHKPVEKKEASREVRQEQSAVGERKIYLGNITRNAVPDHTNVAEQELKQFFSKFGDVEHVGIPRRVLENPNESNRTAFAFITMKTCQDAVNVFKAARKDESRNNQHLLHVKIDAFGFDGEATISEQKAERPSNGFRGGRGGSYGGRGNSQGGFIPRGRGRGGFRGGNQPH